jgi:hypothetical protein
MRAAILILLGTTVAAEASMTAEEFEAFSEGRILAYSNGPVPYGAEAHGPDRQVVWTEFEGRCHEGVWFPRGDQICFLYEEGIVGERCWRFTRTPDGLLGEFVTDPADETAYRVTPTEVDLDCPAPWLGADRATAGARRPS